MKISKASQVINFSEILTLSPQIPYGVLSACLTNIRLKKDIDAELKIIIDSAAEKKATDEEINNEIKQLDERFIAKFRKIDGALVAGLNRESLPVKRTQGESTINGEIDVREVLFMLEDCGIITYL